MKKSECLSIRNAILTGAATPAAQRHLFTCTACRADVRLGQAWRAFPRPSDLETRPVPDEVFIQRVLWDVREDRRRRARVRTGLAAAAALLFFFLAGAAGQMAATASASAEDAADAQLIAAGGDDATDAQPNASADSDLEALLLE
jgi:anti-sigma factor RsiW